jgi:uncharacterized protein (TIGR02145 family)
MKKLSSIIILLFGLVYTNTAQTVTIGNQIWMSKNLDVSTFRNGDPIPEIKSEEEWQMAEENGQPAWCYYDNDPANGEKYGKLYNWHAVNDPRGLAPEGWHIPSEDELDELINFLGGIDLAGVKMKTSLGWDDYIKPFGTKESWKGTNESKFSGLPGGLRYSNGNFMFLGISGSWWSTVEIDEITILRNYFTLYHDSPLVHGFDSDISDGISVRCLKD